MAQITVNGEQVGFYADAISYDDVVYIVRGGTRIHSVTWRDGDRGGILSPGKSVEVKDGMVFNAYVTDNA